MLRRYSFLVVITFWSLFVYSDSQTTTIHERSATRPSTSDPGLALTKQFFKNITKQLQDSIQGNELPTGQDVRYKNFFDKNIFESYHHHEHHWGPYFEAEDGGKKGTSGGTQQIAAHIGSEALLPCRVGMLKDKTVMWLRRTAEDVQLLTVARQPYTGDSRISVKFQYPNNWRLSLSPTRKEDGGLYMCQISTHPPRATLTNLTVLAPILTINGDEKQDIKDRYYKAGSRIKLDCDISKEFLESTSIVAQTKAPTTTTTSTTTTIRTTTTNRISFLVSKSWSVKPSIKIVTEVDKSITNTEAVTDEIEVTSRRNEIIDNFYGILWRKNDSVLEEGVTYFNESSSLLVTAASQNDSATYTCLLKDRASVAVNVHVLIGENQAAVYHDTLNRSTYVTSYLELILIYYTILFICEII